MLLLSNLQSTNYTLVWDQIANKSFVLLNASILEEYREKPSLRSASLQQFIELWLSHFHEKSTARIRFYWRNENY